VHVAFEIKSDTGNNRATETISESFRKYLSNITGITKLRNSKKKSAILNTAHVIRKVIL